MWNSPSAFNGCRVLAYSSLPTPLPPATTLHATTSPRAGFVPLPASIDCSPIPPLVHPSPGGGLPAPAGLLYKHTTHHRAGGPAHAAASEHRKLDRKSVV